MLLFSLGKQHGYDTERFVGYVNEGLLCYICQDVLVNPLQAPCEHAFCSTCIHGWLVHLHNCPEDRQSLDVSVLRPLFRYMKNDLKRLQNRCRNREHGCNMVCSLESIDLHERECEDCWIPCINARKQHGYDTERFVGYVNEGLLCYICQDVLVNPLQAPCEHAFCSTCIHGWLVHLHNCPEDRQSLDVSVLRPLFRYMKNDLKRLQNRCRNREHGCNMVCSLESIDLHERDCEDCWIPCINARKQHGYDTERFVGYVNEGLLCYICQDVLVNPLQAPCEHAFCSTCIHGWLVHLHNCPEDRQSLDVSVLRPLFRYMKNDLKRLQNRCRNREHGCNMVCSLESIDLHERECEDCWIPCINARKQHGYDTERFVGYVNEGLLCYICQDVLVNPLQAPCEHAFCSTCIHGWLVHLHNCPEDRQSLDVSVLRPLFRYMKNDLKRLQNRCRNREHGCNMVCSLESIDLHERDCEDCWIPCINARKQHGYDTERFVGYVNEGLLCYICQDVLVNPLQAPCEHAFCSTCIHGWLVHLHNCPEDRQSLDVSVLRPLFRYMKNDLKRLQNRCRNREHGCNMVCSLESIDLHEQECEDCWIPCINARKQHGYDTERFVGYVNEGLLCYICQDVLVNPLQAPCEHAFCSTCIHGWLVHLHNCPEDRQSLDVSVLRPLFRYMKNDLKRLQNRCRNREHGCNMVCSLESIDLHERSVKIAGFHASMPVRINRTFSVTACTVYNFEMYPNLNILR
ncbi:uncharacterized protein LOC120519842 [Polypterus senegalus]|uniref:uncharacterized protein LOC120519842 n=1 Tax=Polypterus senegalus TaxID=55291 RepID=UPI0019648384|nr:uncharacterized protein LOC120519842 [Polypterus senegalus]